jgi:hypothetical protein
MERITTTLIDDLDKVSEAVDTIVFGYEGKWYRIDLAEGHAEFLRDVLMSHSDAGQAVGASRAAAKAKRPTHRRKSERDRYIRNQQIRTWALANGHKITDRGRIPADVEAAYDQRDQPSTDPIQPDPGQDVGTDDPTSEIPEVTGKVTLRSVPRVEKGSDPGPVTPAAILHWADLHGFTVHPRRKHPTSDMIAAYQQAHAS